MHIDDRRERVKQMWEAGERNQSRIARELGVKRDAVRRDCEYLGLKRGVTNKDPLSKLESEVETFEGSDDRDLKTMLNHVASRKNSVIDELKKNDIFGLTGHDRADAEEILDTLIEKQAGVEQNIQKRYNQVVTINDNKPVGLALIGDLHLGSPGVDYKGLVRDTQLIRSTPGLYALGMGDYHDNWIGKLGMIQRGQPVSFESELALLDWWFEKMDGSLLAVVAGNHDTGRSKMYAGIDLVKRILRSAQPVLYDEDEVVFDVKLCDSQWRFKIRHKWQGSSIYNATHGIERDPKFGDGDFDVGVGAHTHRGTLFRDFMFHGKRRISVLCGTYKMVDRYALRLGFGRSPQNAATGVLILWPDGKIETMHNLKAAAQFLTYLRS